MDPNLLNEWKKRGVLNVKKLINHKIWSLGTNTNDCHILSPIVKDKLLDTIDNRKLIYSG